MVARGLNFWNICNRVNLRAFSTGFVARKAMQKPLILTDSILNTSAMQDKGIDVRPDLTLKITHVPYTALPEMVLNPFKRFGAIKYLHIPYDEISGQLKGLAFLRFENELSAKRASVQMNGFVINNMPIKVELASEVTQNEAKPHYILMLKNLSYEVSDEEIKELLRPYQALSVGLRRAPIGNRPCLGYGFARFDTVSAAKRALEAVAGHKVRGRPIKVRYAKEMDHDYSFIV